MQADPRSHETCTGCSVCLLACPVWQARRDIRYSPQGRAKAIQLGVGIAALAPAIDACTLCGACEPACPEELPLVDMVLDLRRQLAQSVSGRLAVLDAPQPMTEAGAETLLVGGGDTFGTPALAGRVARLLGAALAPDSGEDLVTAMESGTPLPDARVERFLRTLRRAQLLVVADALLLRRLRQWLPAARVLGSGEALSALPAIRSALAPGDFYVIGAGQFHAARERLVGHYDRLRQASGCAMNLDLQRLAVPTTAGSLATRTGRSGVDPVAQARWMLEGLMPVRVVVEDAADLAPMREAARCPVLHVAELCDG